MRKVELNMKEDFKYKIIKNLVENDGNKKKAALKLNCKLRTINRLIIQFNLYGKKAFIHGNHGRTPSCSFSPEVKAYVIEKYINEYSDTNFAHFCEILNEDDSILISDNTLRNWLISHYVVSPKAKRKTKNNMTKLLKVKLNNEKSKKVKNEIKETISLIDSSVAHPRRPKSKYFGEMIQMDASSFEWVPGIIWHLHLAIDDATNEVVGAYFDTQETLNGYYNTLYQILTNYGIPAMFYTDKRTVFEYIRKNNAFDDDDTFTQFSYACHTLGIDIKTTSVAQAKGRIERLNQTFQSRLPVELRRHNINNIEAANEFLKSYLKKFNSLFALQVNITKSVFEKQPPIEKINCTLAILTPRKFDSASCIRYKNNYYIPKSSQNIPYYFKNKTDGIVIESFDKKLYINVLDTLYALDQIPKHEKYSKEFDQEEESKIKEKYIPSLDHPWRNDDILGFFARQKHRQSSAHV
ncbi:MAG: ISNCY family transposase [Coprobacillus sp.]